MQAISNLFFILQGIRCSLDYPNSSMEKASLDSAKSDEESEYSYDEEDEEEHECEKSEEKADAEILKDCSKDVSPDLVSCKLFPNSDRI